LSHLKKNPWDAASLIWTLNLDGTTIYAVSGEGPFAGDVYLRLREFLDDHIELQGSERVSMPGRISGKARLMNGQIVPVIAPELRGMYSWTTQGLVHAVVGAPLAESASAAEKETRAKKQAGLREFLDRVYFQLYNLGVTPQERAINFAGTNAFNIEKVYESAMKEEMDLDTIEVERSPICRPESDCWHVKLFFFFPDRQVQTVRKIYRFTVDVSDVVPVTVGPVRSWFVR
jgi:cyanobactin maturation PatA/PatG family protease